MIKAVCSIIVWGRAGFAELLILHIRSCLIWVMTASILLRPSVTVWILRTVVPGGTSLEKLYEWTGHWPWHRMPSNRKESRWRKWCITKPLCRAAYLFLMCPFLQQTVHFLKMLLMHAPQISHTAHMHTHVLPWYSIIYTVHTLAYVPEVCSFWYFSTIRTSLQDKYLPHGSGTLWCQYRDHLGCRFSLYTTLSWPEIPQPTLVNTPTDLKTNCRSRQTRGSEQIVQQATQGSLPCKCTYWLQLLLVLQ